MRTVLSTISLLIVFLVSACRTAVLTKEELRNYIKDEDNGLTYTSMNDDSIKMEVSIIRPELLKKMPKSTNSFKYFIVSYSKNGREAINQMGKADKYAQLNQNLAFDLTKYCHLIVDKKDTLAAANCLFTNTYGLAASNTILLVFDTPMPKKLFELDIDELGFKTGNKKFEFKKKNIDNLYQVTVK